MREPTVIKRGFAPLATGTVVSPNTPPKGLGEAEASPLVPWGAQFHLRIGVWGHLRIGVGFHNRVYLLDRCSLNIVKSPRSSLAVCFPRISTKVMNSTGSSGFK